MLAQEGYLDLASLEGAGDLLSRYSTSDEVERDITTLLLAKGPELSAKNSFRIAASLIDAAAATISSLQSRVATLEADRDKLRSQEADWESLLSKWRDMAMGLKSQIRDLEGKLVEANQRSVRAEMRAQNAEDEIINAQRGSFDLCDRVIAAFGAGTLTDGMSVVPSEVAGSC